MNFGIFYDKQPEKFLFKLDKQISLRIIEKIEASLGSNPVPHNAVSVTGHRGVFRIRIGDYRALYRINYAQNKIIIITIDKRPHVYDF